MSNPRFEDSFCQVDSRHLGLFLSPPKSLREYSQEISEVLAQKCYQKEILNIPGAKSWEDLSPEQRDHWKGNLPPFQAKPQTTFKYLPSIGFVEVIDLFIVPGYEEYQIPTAVFRFLQKE